jgi:ribonuclease HI
MTKPNPPKKKVPPLAPEQFQISISDLLASVNVTDCDLVLAGDGSGCERDKPNGFACYIDDRLNPPELIHGGVSFGSNNFAEVAAYFFALRKYHGDRGAEKIKILNRPLHVAIFTDSQVAVAQWATVRSQLPDNMINGEIWAGIQYLARQGYIINFYYAKRKTLAANWACDQLAGKARLAITDVYLEADGYTQYEVSPVDLHPEKPNKQQGSSSV